MKSIKTKSVDIGPSVEQLLDLMRQFPDVRDEADLTLGRKTIRISMDSVYLGRMLDQRAFHNLQKEILREAIDDIASGATTMMNSYFGIKSVGGRLERACGAYSDPEPLVYKIELKDAAAFAGEGGPREFELHEQTANAAIYFLIDQICLTK